MIILTLQCLQKPLGRSRTENRIFVFRIQISVQFPGHLSCHQTLGGELSDCDLFFLREGERISAKVSEAKSIKACWCLLEHTMLSWLYCKSHSSLVP